MYRSSSLVPSKLCVLRCLCLIILELLRFISLVIIKDFFVLSTILTMTFSKDSKVTDYHFTYERKRHLEVEILDF